MSSEWTELTCAALIEILSFISSSIEQYQGDNALCNYLKVNIMAGQAAAEKIFVHNYLICYIPKNAR